MSTKARLPNLIPEKYYIISTADNQSNMFRVYSDRTDIFLEHERKMELMKYMLKCTSSSYLLWEKTNLLFEIDSVKTIVQYLPGYRDLETGLWQKAECDRVDVESGRTVPVCRMSGWYCYLFSEEGQEIVMRNSLEWITQAFIKVLQDTVDLHSKNIYHNHLDLHYIWVNESGVFLTGLEEADVVVCDDLFDYPMHCSMLPHHVLRLNEYKTKGLPIRRYDLASMEIGTLFQLFWQPCSAKFKTDADVTYFVHSVFSKIGHFHVQKTMMYFLETKVGGESVQNIISQLFHSYDMGDFTRNYMEGDQAPVEIVEMFQDLGSIQTLESV